MFFSAEIHHVFWDWDRSPSLDHWDPKEIQLTVRNCHLWRTKTWIYSGTWVTSQSENRNGSKGTCNMLFYFFNTCMLCVSYLTFNMLLWCILFNVRMGFPNAIHGLFVSMQSFLITFLNQRPSQRCRAECGMGQKLSHLNGEKIRAISTTANIWWGKQSFTYRIINWDI